MTVYQKILSDLGNKPKKWLITGVAGFIGSNLLERLLLLDQYVVGLDNFATGYHYNLREVQSQVSTPQWERFKFVEADICELPNCTEVFEGVDYVLHQAALGSVPRSIVDPIATNNVNVQGFLNVLVAARDMGVQRFVYAASSSTYGDHPVVPKVEDVIGQPLSPYAVTKYVNELYADVFSKNYGFYAIGLRYFNVFGRRQDPSGAYAAVIPKWISAMIKGEQIFINGDGSTTRDFCYVDNVVQANILSAVAGDISSSQVYNVAYGAQTSLNELFSIIKNELENKGVYYNRAPVFRDFREGDVKHSWADISKASSGFGYAPAYSLQQGLAEAISWYVDKVN